MARDPHASPPSGTAPTGPPSDDGVGEQDSEVSAAAENVAASASSAPTTEEKEDKGGRTGADSEVESRDEKDGSSSPNVDGDAKNEADDAAVAAGDTDAALSESSPPHVVATKPPADAPAEEDSASQDSEGGKRDQRSGSDRASHNVPQEDKVLGPSNAKGTGRSGVDGGEKKRKNKLCKVDGQNELSSSRAPQDNDAVGGDILDAASEGNVKDEARQKDDDDGGGGGKAASEPFKGGVEDEKKKPEEGKNGYTHACYLCRRKFPSHAKLRKHERKSTLHKANLAKQKKKATDGGGEADSRRKRQILTPDGREDRKRVKMEEEEPQSAVDRSGSGAPPPGRGSRRRRGREPSLSNRASSGPVMVWKCGTCLTAIFDTYDEAFQHETRCARRRARDLMETASVATAETSSTVAAEPVVESAKARKARKEQEAKQRKKKEEYDRLKAQGVQVGGKGTPLTISPEIRAKLSDANSFILDNVELFSMDKTFNEQLVSMDGAAFLNGTSKVKLRAVGIVGFRCIHCRHLPLWERERNSCMFPGSIKTMASGLHGIGTAHFGVCKSLPNGFRGFLKKKRESQGMGYVHGKIGMKQFCEMMAGSWNLENSTSLSSGGHGLKFKGARLVAPKREDYLAAAVFDDSDSGATNKATSDVSKQSTGGLKRSRNEGNLDSKKRAKHDENKSDSDGDLCDRFGNGYSCSMYVPGEDEENCSAIQIYVRQHCTEAFVMTPGDVERCIGRNQKAQPGQVGIRCVYCRSDPVESQSPASTAIPSSTHGLYDSYSKITADHIERCDAVPASVQERVADLRQNGMTGSKKPRKYFHTSAKRVGLENSPQGMRLNPYTHKRFLEEKDQAPEKLAGERFGPMIYSLEEIEPPAPNKKNLRQWPEDSTLRLEIDVGEEYIPVDFYRDSTGARCLHSGCSRSWTASQFASGHVNSHNLKAHARSHLEGTLAGRAGQAPGPEKVSKRRKAEETVFRSLPFILGGADEEGEFSSVHAMARKMLEVFVVSDKSESDALSREHRMKVKVGRVGLRCIHCHCRRYFPTSVGDIYTRARLFTYDHFQKCTSVPENVRKMYNKVREETNTRKSNAYDQYKARAEEAGLYDLPRSGVGAHNWRRPSLDTDDSDGSDDEEGEADDEEDSDSDTDSVSSVESNGDDSLPRNQIPGDSKDHPTIADLIRPKERVLLAKLKYEIFSHLRLCYLTEKDRQTGPRKTLPSGLAGVACKHCSKVKFYATTPQTLWQSRLCPSNVYGHFQECRKVPEKCLARLKKCAKSDADDKLLHSRKNDHQKIHSLLWNRMMTRAVELKYMSTDAVEYSEEE